MVFFIGKGAHKKTFLSGKRKRKRKRGSENFLILKDFLLCTATACEYFSIQQLVTKHPCLTFHLNAVQDKGLWVTEWSGGAQDCLHWISTRCSELSFAITACSTFLYNACITLPPHLHYILHFDTCILHFAFCLLNCFSQFLPTYDEQPWQLPRVVDPSCCIGRPPPGIVGLCISFIVRMIGGW